jgi:hypothetical protein
MTPLRYSNRPTLFFLNVLYKALYQSRKAVKISSRAISISKAPHEKTMHGTPTRTIQPKGFPEGNPKKAIPGGTMRDTPHYANTVKRGTFLGEALSSSCLSLGNYSPPTKPVVEPPL